LGLTLDVWQALTLEGLGRLKEGVTCIRKAIEVVDNRLKKAKSKCGDAECVIVLCLPAWSPS
jgi:hypothetical protein